MTQTETSKAKILFVEVPNDANEFKLHLFSRAGLWLKQKDSKSLNGFDCKIPKGNWQILSTLKDVTEEQLRIIFGVEGVTILIGDKKPPSYLHPFYDYSYELKKVATSLGLCTDKNYAILYEPKT